MASICLRVKSQQAFHHVVMLRSEAWDYVGQTLESESAPFVAAIFIQLLGSTRSNLLYQRVSPWRKREGAGVTKDEKKE